MSIILGGLLPGSVLIYQCLSIRGPIPLTDEVPSAEALMRVPVDSDLVMAAIVAATVTISCQLWMLSFGLPNRPEL